MIGEVTTQFRMISLTHVTSCCRHY